MRTLHVAAALWLLLSAGCSPKQGNGLWRLTVGGEARIVSADGSDVVIETLAPAAPGSKSARRPRTPGVETLTLPSGTKARVLAIDGDDARIEILDGPRRGATCWVECTRLEQGGPS